MGSFLLDTVVKPAGEAAKATSGTTQSTGLFGTWMTDHPVMLIVVYCVVLLVIMYFPVHQTHTEEGEKAG